uniref:ELMO domain-containing protein n=1 Tax=Aegilops tauschii subsp. strangulata TaxID=200361 RepID=A0A452XNI6_AEGTS|nr:uncharacterized protein LOC109758788 isoform X6 [Aegilops tauschii subsp. strangulata]
MERDGMARVRSIHRFQKSYEQLLCKQNGDRALWEYPFAVAGVNITFMLIQMLDLQTGFDLFTYAIWDLDSNLAANLASCLLILVTVIQPIH